MLISYTVCYIELLMNGRKLYREYAQAKGKEAKEFVEIKPEWYNEDQLFTKDNNGNLEQTTIDYKEMVHWIIKDKPNSI